METDNSLDTSRTTSPNNFEFVKQEPIDSNSMHNSSPVASDPIVSKSVKRKEREKNVCIGFYTVYNFIRCFALVLIDFVLISSFCEQI